jgi:hypothetical protein
MKISKPFEVEHEISVEDDGVFWIRAFARDFEGGERELRFTGSYNPTTIQSVETVTSGTFVACTLKLLNGPHIRMNLAHSVVAEQWKVARDRWRAAHG